MNDNAFITARTDEVFDAYCDAVGARFLLPRAETMASEVLYHNLHFSKYDTLVSVLEQEFEKELPSPLPERLALILLNNKAIQAVFAKYELTDDFAAGTEYDKLYTELPVPCAAHRGQWSANDRRREHGLILHHRGLL